MIPSIDEIQYGINQLSDAVVEISKGIAWDREFSWEYSEAKGN